MHMVVCLNNRQACLLQCVAMQVIEHHVSEIAAPECSICCRQLKLLAGNKFQNVIRWAC